MNKVILVLFAILTFCTTAIQATEACEPSCPRSIPANMSSREEAVTRTGFCVGRCSGTKTCTGSTTCIYNPRTGALQGISAECKCRSGDTPVPSQVVRALTMDLAQKKDIAGDVWDKRYLDDVVNDDKPDLN